MLKIFRTSNPLTLLPLLAYLLILKAGYFIFPFETTINTVAPLTVLLYDLLGNTLGQSHFWQVGLAAVAIFIQALMVNKVVNDHDLIENDNYIPAVSYILITSLFQEFHWLSAPLLSAFFIIPAIYKVLSVYKQEKADMHIFDAGLLVSIASLFYFPALLLFIWIFIAIASLKPFSIREWLIVIIGVLAPYILVFTWYFWFDQQQLLWEHIISFTGPYQMNIIPDGYFLAKWLILVIISVWFLFNSLQFTISGGIRIRKYISQVILLLIFALLSILFQPEVAVQHSFLAFIPLAMIFAINFNYLKQVELVEIPHLLLIITILITQYLNFALIKNLF